MSELRDERRDEKGWPEVVRHRVELRAQAPRPQPEEDKRAGKALTVLFVTVSAGAMLVAVWAVLVVVMGGFE